MSDRTEIENGRVKLVDTGEGVRLELRGIDAVEFEYDEFTDPNINPGKLMQKLPMQHMVIDDQNNVFRYYIRKDGSVDYVFVYTCFPES